MSLLSFPLIAPFWDAAGHNTLTGCFWLGVFAGVFGVLSVDRLYKRIKATIENNERRPEG
jgi:hypothetical protein